MPVGVVEAARSSRVTQTSSEVHNESPNFLYFTGIFGLLVIHTAPKTPAIFFAQTRPQITLDHMFDHN